MDQTINLEAKNGRLELQIGINGWSQVRLIKETAISLGAEGVDYVIKHLVETLDKFLNLQLPQSEKLVWVLSLFEKHGVIYARYENNGLLFYFQDEEGKKIDTLILTFDECKLWKQKLQTVSIIQGKN